MAALPSAQTVSQLVMRGRTLEGDLAEALTGGEVSVSIDTLSEISLIFYDPKFELLAKGLFLKGASVSLGALKQEIAVIETGPASDGLGQVTVKAWASVVGKLKARIGPYVLRNQSASQFVQRECKAVGASYVIQGSATRKTVARDTSWTDAAGARPSSWTTFERLAQEQQFLLFEVGGVIYFGTLKWIRSRTTRLSVITWNTGKYTDCRTVPEFRTALDTADPLSSTFSVPRERAQDFLPANRVRVSFPAFGDDYYIVTSLTYPLSGNDDATVGVSRP